MTLFLLLLLLWLINTHALGGVVNRRAFVSVGAAAALSTASPPSFAESIYNPQLASLDHDLVVITGGTTGLGLETAKRLAKAGASVVITSRTEAKGQAAVQAIRDSLPSSPKNQTIVSMVLDLDSLDNVKSFATRLQQRLGQATKIDTLINNAGVMAIPKRQLTQDGYEETFQSNHLGHFVLTAGLLPLLTDKAKIINVSSSAYKLAGNMKFDNLNSETFYNPWSAYAQSKLANILFTRELQARLERAGSHISVYCLHPGAVQTDLGRYVIGVDKWQQLKEKGTLDSPLEKQLLSLLQMFVKTVPEGASTQIYLASVQDPHKGAYFVDQHVEKLSEAAMDETAARELWRRSEQMSGIQFLG
jgi:NAD(P)-dependent dehydrogenase (short-subunit alcohol dehydrogenase family)